MGQDFFRRVDGYNYPFNCTTSNALSGSGTVIASAPAGPGRVEGIHIIISYPPVPHFTGAYQDTFSILIDGNTYITGVMNTFLPTWNLTSPYIGPFFAYKYEVNLFEMLEFKLPLDYETSFVATLTDAIGATSLYHRVSLYGRVGR
jgi:hypothetical protein